MTRIAFAGLGAMGLPMATNLLKRGFAVCGYDVNARTLEAFAASGGVRAASAAEAARGADVLVLMVVNASQAGSVLFEDGALDVLAPDAIVCLMATCAPGAVKAIAARVAQAGRRFVDAPVSGGVGGATRGALTIMAATDGATFAAIRPVFDALGQRIFHVGTEPGQGATMKAVNQLLCGVHIAVAGEAFALARKVGLDLDVVLEILGGSAASSWMLKDRGPRMLQANPEVASAVDIFVKDLGIVLETGRETKSALPIAAAAHQMFLAASGRGDGTADDSQVIRSYDVLNGAVAAK
jgi:3-hydroxyisobutyrate dehydrogenase